MKDSDIIRGDEFIEDAEEPDTDGESSANGASVTVGEERVGMRLDEAAASMLDVTRSAAARLIDEGAVRVGGAKKTKSYRLRLGDEITAVIPEPQSCEAEPENIPLDIVYEDEWLIVVNKPKGMVVHPAAGVTSGTLVNALLYHCGDSLSGIGGVTRPGIVHRLDKDTSGLIVAAKNDRAHLLLSEQWKETKALRKYEAVLIGVPKQESGEVNAPIGRHPTDRKKMAVIIGGREALTQYRLLDVYTRDSGGGASDGGSLSRVELTLKTGRTHQIRVHMASIGHPVFGDSVYGGDRTPFAKRCASVVSGQCLHARTLGFIHPGSGELMQFDTQLPQYFEKVIRLAREG